MSDKKVIFQEEPEVKEFIADADEKADVDGDGKKKGKHSLDSDEDDDDADKYDVLNEDDIEGQEDGTIDYDDDIQITPFNMRDEMEEGHFDADGNFIFDKTKNIKDNWIENIDWVRIKETERQKAMARIQEREDAQENEAPPVDRVATYKEMLDLVKPQETVARALRRLGKSKGKPLTTAQRWKAKRQKVAAGGDSKGGAGDDGQAERDKAAMLRLTEMADALVTEGMMEVYEFTHEKLAVMLKQLEEKDGPKFSVPDDVDDDDALDMFAENFDKAAGDSKGAGDAGGGGEDKDKGKQSSTAAEASGATVAEEAEENDVRWEYKEKEEEEETKGPFTTEQMLNWKEDGTFVKPVLCRRLGTRGQFYSSSRVDFDLYI